MRYDSYNGYKLPLEVLSNDDTLDILSEFGELLENEQNEFEREGNDYNDYIK